MSKTYKSSQEMAAQIMSAYPSYSDNVLPKKSAKKLTKEASALKVEVEAMRPYLMSDSELGEKLADIIERAINSGVWEPHKGHGSKEILEFATMKNQGFGYSKKEAEIKAFKDLKYEGYLAAIKYDLKEREQVFREPVLEYLKNHQIDSNKEKQEINNLLKVVFDITNLSEEKLAKILEDFPSGNFLYHGSGTEQIIKIIDSGALLNAKALYDNEKKSAKKENLDVGILSKNSGYEGISWSMNEIDALPGDRYHLAGFVAAPESILSENTQLVIPSRPSPNELVLFDGHIDSKLYYEAQTQIELFEAYDRNSVLGGLLDLVTGQTMDGDIPALKKLAERINKDTGLLKILEQGFTLAPDNSISLNPDLLSSIGPENELPVAAFWLQALVRGGRLNGTVFADKSISEIIGMLTEENVKQLYKQMHLDVDAAKLKLKDEPNNVRVQVEAMYLLVSNKDVGDWLKILSRSNHKPAGIILYDADKVRLENFASLHRGDNIELTKELQTIISTDNDDYINYNALLGLDFTDGMRAGHKRQVMAERYLNNRKSLRKKKQKLLVI